MTGRDSPRVELDLPDSIAEKVRASRQWLARWDDRILFRSGTPFAP
jgi:hypothetical protein